MSNKLILPIIMLLSTIQISIGQTVPDLGDNASKFILFTAPGALTNGGTSTVYGNVGTNNSIEYDGFTPGTVLKGTAEINTDISVDAGNELNAAYLDFATNTVCGTTLGVTLTGPQTLSSGIYCTGGATTISGDITLDGGNNPNAVFLFKIGGALSVDATASIVLTGGAQISNVYFQVDGATDLAGGSVFRGTLVANGAIRLLGNSTLYGKALSTSGLISLENNLIASSESPLPVTLVSFNAIKSESNTAHLTWTTATESNSDYFEIQTSLTGKDWRKAGTVKAGGESKQTTSYDFITESVGQGLNFYRLKMVDLDQTFAYSRIRQVEFASNIRTVMYPNPAVDRLTLDVDDIAMIQRIQLNDISGRMLLDQSKVGAVNMSQNVDIQSLPSGMYTISITRSGGTVTHLKIFKL